MLRPYINIADGEDYFMTTMGKYRHFSRVTTAAGHFTVLAVDHRSNLLERLQQVSDTDFGDADFIAFKQEILEYLVPHTSAVLADPTYVIGTAITSGVVHGQLGLLSPVEVTNYNTHPSQRDMQMIPHWSVEKIKMIGGDGVKMLLPYHPDSETIEEKYDSVRQIIADCEQYDLPFYLEPIPYSLDPDKKLENAEYLDIYLKMCTTFCEMGVDSLKLPFPVDHTQSTDENEWKRACELVTETCTVPWALLSAGVTYDTFLKQTQIACQAGASGIIVGRAVWSEAIELSGAARTEFLATTAANRMQELADVCGTYARPWHDDVDVPDSSMGWYENY